MINGWLVAAGSLSTAASLLHLGCIVGGPSWYRFFGAGERMARMAERGLAEPAVVTLAIAVILTIWAAYAFSGAGLIPRLPLLRIGLVAICAVYLTRAAALPLMLGYVPRWSPAFLWISSAIVLAIGLVHLVGVVRGWDQLAPGGSI